MTKPTDISIVIRLPHDRGGLKVSITPSGEVVLISKDGAEVIPESMERTVHYPRPKGPKVKARSKALRDHVSFGGLAELTKYSAVYAIDTNTRVIGGTSISAACFLQCRFIREGDSIRVEAEEGRLNVYEFHNAQRNPEMLAILKVARDVSVMAPRRRGWKVAFITDSELGSHDAINARKKPIFGAHYLPRGFGLLYASQLGGEIPNYLLRFCDKQSSDYLGFIERGSVKDSPFQPLAEDPGVLYRFLSCPGLTINAPPVPVFSPGPDAKLAIYGILE